jgi:FMN phosphatase YigB (HAD superfamily)
MRETTVKRPAAIFDVDGTLVNVSSVRHHVMGEKKRFDLFHGGALECPQNENVVDILRIFQDLGFAILIVTARNERWFYHTLFWLREHEIEFDEIFMRGDKDNRPDYEIKGDILKRINVEYDVRVAVDDNPNVIRLWEENGIQTVIIDGWGEAK